MQIDLAKSSWTVGPPLQADPSGFGRVFEATSVAGDQVVAKFVPIEPGADRELLFAELSGTPNVVPILDSGQHDQLYVLIMPRADMSLRRRINEAGGALDPSEVVEVLTDVATALQALSSRHEPVVHRDLKPENILLLNGSWCLADFGISRYAEASTSTDTHKFSKTPQYAAPEQWRSERAEPPTDIYALGVISYEMLSGMRPFIGPTEADFRDQHLHGQEADLTVGSPRLRNVVHESLYKAAVSRPSAANLLARLAAEVTDPRPAGSSRLSAVNDRLGVERRVADRRLSMEESAATRRREIAAVAAEIIRKVGRNIVEVVEAEAPLAYVVRNEGSDPMWSAQLGGGKLAMSGPYETDRDSESLGFEVYAHAFLTLNRDASQSGYRGRSHSFWYCDAIEEGEFHWYELAFMDSPFSANQSPVVPFGLGPGRDSAQALSHVIGTKQLAWPFTEIDLADLNELTDRWLGWFADAADRSLERPSNLPEVDIGTYRW